MADPACPLITFLVNLASAPGLSPNAYQSDKDLGRTYDTNQKGTRVTYFPGLLVGWYFR